MRRLVLVVSLCGASALALGSCAPTYEISEVSPSPSYVPVACDEIGARADDPSRELDCYETTVALPLSESFAPVVESFAPSSRWDPAEQPRCQDRIPEKHSICDQVLRTPDGRAVIRVFVVVSPYGLDAGATAAKANVVVEEKPCEGTVGVVACEQD